ncbi:MAG TPA: ABC transporter ATP-binding protein [Rhizomicrobium sp.]
MTSDPSWRGLQGAFGGLAILDRRQRTAFAAAGALILGATVLDVAGVAFTYVIIRALVDPAGAAKLPLVAYLYRHGALGTLRWLPVSVSLLYLAFIVAKNVYGIAVTWHQERMFARMAAALGASLLTSYLHASWNAMSLRKTAEMTNVADVAGGPTLTSVLRAYLTLANELSVFVAVLALLVCIAPGPTFIAVCLLGSFFGIVQRGVRARIEALGRACTALANERLQFFQQCLEGGREIRISNRIPWFVARFAELRVREAQALQSIMSLQSIPRYLAEPVLFGAMTIVILFMTLASARSNVALPTLGIFAVAGFRLMPSFSRSLAAGATLLGFAHPVSVLRRDLALPRERADASGAEPGRPLEREITLSSVSYRYPGRDEPALSDVSFALAKGDAVAIVGASGAGKSTLADILVGLRRPDAGLVSVDGVDVAANMAGWRAMIGYVPQAVSLFDASLRENVAFGVDAGMIDDDRVRHVLSLVQLDALLAKLGGALASRIGERGTSVSVGERQRIGIARALYDDRKILVMDEATAALDNNTEDLLGSAIEGLLGQCTVLIVAHRLATIRRCRSIIVLGGGKIVDRGGYEELLERSPEFARLVRAGAFGAEGDV